MYAAQLNQQVRDNLNYLKGETDAFDAHAAAGAAVHQLAAGVYVAGFRGAAGKWMDANVGTISGTVSYEMNLDSYGEITPSFASAYSSAPYVFTDNRGPVSLGVTQAYNISTSGFTMRAYRNSVATNTCSWFAIGG
ncbi:MAG: hypothetical protein FJZ89_09105 [Chloroflexi bacterium]|nr:hypothetical protein [Chloroflexota bacterium]